MKSPVRFNGPVSFRYSGNGKLKGADFNSLGLKVLGVGEQINKNFHHFVYEKKFDSGLIIRCEKTRNGDRIVYIYVPGGECNYDLPGIIIKVQSLAVESLHKLNTITLLFEPVVLTLKDEVSFFNAKQDELRVANAGLWCGQLQVSTSVKPDSYCLMNVRSSNPALKSNYNISNAIQSPNDFIFGITDKVISSEEYFNLKSAYTGNLIPKAEKGTEYVGAIGMLFDESFKLRIYSEYDDVTGIMTLKAAKLSSACSISMAAEGDKEVLCSFDFSTYNTFNMTEGDGYIDKDSFHVARFISWNKTRVNATDPFLGTFMVRQELKTNEGILYTEEELWDIDGHEQPDLDIPPNTYIWNSEPLWDASRGLIYRVMELELTLVDGDYVGVLTKKMEGDTLIDNTIEVTPPPRYTTKTDGSSVSTVANVSTITYDQFEQYDRSPNIEKTYPLESGYFNGVLNIVKAKIISVTSRLETTTGTLERTHVLGGSYPSGGSTTTASNTNIDIDCEISDSIGSIIPSFKAYKYQINGSTVFSVTDTGSVYTQSNSWPTANYHLEGFAFSVCDAEHRVYSYLHSVSDGSRLAGSKTHSKSNGDENNVVSNINESNTITMNEVNYINNVRTTTELFTSFYSYILNENLTYNDSEWPSAGIFNINFIPLETTSYCDFGMGCDLLAFHAFALRNIDGLGSDYTATYVGHADYWLQALDIIFASNPVLEPAYQFEGGTGDFKKQVLYPVSSSYGDVRKRTKIEYDFNSQKNNEISTAYTYREVPVIINFDETDYTDTSYRITIGSNTYNSLLGTGIPDVDPTREVISINTLGVI